MTNAGQVQKKAKKPVPKKFQKLIKELNMTLKAMEKAKSDKEITKHLQKLVDMYDKLFDYIFIYKDGKEEMTATIFNEFWKIPKFQEYLSECAGGISAFTYKEKTGEEKEFDDLFWFVKGNQANLSEALKNASVKKQETAVKLLIKYLTEYIPYSNKVFEKELDSLKGMSADGLRPEKDGKLVGKLNREIVFASLLYLRRYYGVTKGGMKNKDLAVFEVKPKIKVVPKKPPLVPKKLEKKKKPEEKYTKKEKQILKELNETKEAIEAWEQLMAFYASSYGLIFKSEEDATIENVIMELRSMGDGAYLAANELLDYADAIIEIRHTIGDKIADKGLFGHFKDEYAYMFVFYYDGNMLDSAIETVKERLGLKEPEFLKELPTLQEQFEKFKEEKLLEQLPSISANTAPPPTPAEQAEVEKMTIDPSYAICKHYGPALCKVGQYEMSKEEKIETLEMLILLIPVVGPVYSLGVDVKRIKERLDILKEVKEMEKEMQALLLAEAKRLENDLEENKETLSPEEIHFMLEEIDARKKAAGDWKEWAKEGAMVTMDLAFLGLDVFFIGSFVVKSGARWAGRDALMVMQKEVAAGKLVTTVEKDIMVKAMTELSTDEFKHFLRIAKDKGGVRKVVEEMAEAAGKKEITTDLMKGYLKKNPLPKGIKGAYKKGKAWVNEVIEIEDGLSMFSKQKFRKRVIVRFYQDLIPNIDFKAVAELSDLMHAAKLGKTGEKYAVDTIFSTMLSFDKLPQQKLLQGLKEGKFTWKEIISGIAEEEKALMAKEAVVMEGDSLRAMATRNVLQDLLPSYKIAYKKAPYEHWLNLGLFIAGLHMTMPMVEYIKAKGDEKKKEAEDMMRALTDSEQADAIMKMFMTSQALEGII
jgi:hypothetical protein